MLVCAREVGAGPLPIADNMAESLNDCLNDAIVTAGPSPMGMFEMVFWWRRMRVGRPYCRVEAGRRDH